MNLLIAYVRIIGHDDPNFTEFTYGDCNARGEQLKRDLEPGDYVFFHTTVCANQVITAYYVVERAMDIREATRDKRITARYKALPTTDDVVLFGDRITSRVLEKPLPFDRALLRKLSLQIPFRHGRTQAQNIASATRAWRILTPADVNVLMREIQSCERRPSGVTSADKMLSTEEVSNTIEKDVESLIAERPHLLGRGLRLRYRQYDTEVGRIDLVLEDGKHNLVIVELKLDRVGRTCISQLRRYMSWAKKGSRGKNVRGIVVCSGVLPQFQDDFTRLKGIQIFMYGWKLQVAKWHNGRR